MMKVSNVGGQRSMFEVLHTTKRSQSAVMTLKPGGESSEEMNVHKSSDQVVYIISGEVEVETGEEKKILKTGDTCIIPAGTAHRLSNRGSGPAATFNVYSPPEYSPNESS